MPRHRGSFCRRGAIEARQELPRAANFAGESGNSCRFVIMVAAVFTNVLRRFQSDAPTPFDGMSVALSSLESNCLQKEAVAASGKNCPKFT
jgi:hypothetical protein